MLATLMRLSQLMQRFYNLAVSHGQGVAGHVTHAWQEVQSPGLPGLWRRRGECCSQTADKAAGIYQRRRRHLTQGNTDWMLL